MIRRISWVKSARKAFQTFPGPAQDQMIAALRLAAHGEKADIAKPVKGLGAGIYEIALAHRGDAYRAVYAVQLGDDLWVVHAFQKKSKSGIKTPQQDIDLLRERIKRLKEQL
jgi:phage-related protein